ncbi:hypothetical protein I6N90_02620 [Paenibacillus sp. GSMTC-2017]|uniref:phage baseplate protein n=1 Tax=Paenibacillus sp. GSMTC-2017 TaxID=2794350 RepID=UPI0018D640CD|nr:hypothetical protein [Paenibacillus sp. GSMTC-2017]MBH5316702.1 hypothetical protein [Paenibacillus sp. GSMTC-2017]
MAILNGQYIHVINEDPSYEVDITDQPVEKGINLSDHVQRKPRTLSLNGYIVGDDAAQVRAKIISNMDQGIIAKYVGRNAFTGLITSFSSKHDHRVANGFSFSLTIKSVRIATTSYEGTLPTPLGTQVDAVDNSGLKQPKEKSPSSKGKTSSPKSNETTQKAVIKIEGPWQEG